MKLCIAINGKEIEEDVMLFTVPVTLWFRVDPGHDGEPPRTEFSVNGQVVAGEFPCHVVSTAAKHSVKVALTSKGAAAEASGRPVEIFRTLTFVPRGTVLAHGLLAGAVALLWILTLWKLGIALQNGQREIKSLWSLEKLLPHALLISSALFATLGISKQRVRSYVYGQQPRGLLGAACLAGLSLLFQVCLLRATSNASPETIQPFTGLATELEPDSTTLGFAWWAKKSDGPFQSCLPGKDCEPTDGSLTAYLLRFMSWETHVVKCQRGGNQAEFSGELQNDKSCTPDPARIIERSAAQLPVKPRADAASGDESGIRYELRPFAAGLEQRFESLATSLTRVSPRPGETSAISELVLDGHDLVHAVHIPWKGLNGAPVTAYAPWPRKENVLVTGRVLSGTNLLGALVCASPGLDAELAIDFARSRARLRRISVERLAPGTVDNGSFYQSYEVQRPELLTHVPWCKRSGAAPDPSNYALDLYLDESWTPQNWSMTLPVRVVSVHIHGKNGDGRLSWNRKAELALPLELVSHEIPADVRAFEGAHYSWQAHASTARNRAAVWALKQDDSFDVELWGGDKRKARKSAGFKLERAPLRRCFIDKRTNAELERPNPTCKSDGVVQWLANFPHAGCSSTASLLCAP